MVQAGSPVDDTIALLSQYMQPEDILIDGGNEWFPNSQRRATTLEATGIHFLGMGISGGEEGARNGPSLMPGGPRAAYDICEPILAPCAAQVADGACISYMGPIGSGNYVKMIHNGKCSFFMHSFMFSCMKSILILLQKHILFVDFLLIIIL